MLRKRSGSTVDEIYEVLHDRIVNGFYAPGVKMSQVELADELNTSRTPLREALNRLQANGLLVATNNRGMEVAPVRFEETEQYYAVRLLMEPPLTAMLSLELGEAELEAMARALEEMERSSYATKVYQQAHHDFHEVMLKRYPAAIRAMVESLYLRIYRHQRLHFTRPQIPDDFNRIDRHLLDAMRARDPRLVRQWLEFHLIDAGLGLTLDIDPDHIPQALFLAAKGIGIELECTDDKLTRPVDIRWVNPDTAPMPAIETVNLRLVV